MSLRKAATSSANLRSFVRCASTTAARNAPAPKSIDDSTSALDYKMHRTGVRLPHLTNQHPRSQTAEEAVTNILYNTPPPSTEPYKRHLLNCLVQNEPGVLSRVSGILAGRGFNIDSLVVCQTEIRDLSRMCIVLRGQDGVIEQARRQLEDLVPVWAVLDYTRTPTIERELLLAKVSILGPEFAQAQLSPTGSDASASLDAAIEAQDPANPPGFVDASGDKVAREQSLARTFESSGAAPLYPSRREGPGMSASEVLIAKNLHLGAIKTLTDQFGGRVVDVGEDSVIVEVTAKGRRVDAFLNLMRPFGLLEAARSGVMVLPRTPIPNYGEEEAAVEDVGEIDASMLPPG